MTPKWGLHLGESQAKALGQISSLVRMGSFQVRTAHWLSWRCLFLFLWVRWSEWMTVKVRSGAKAPIVC